MDNKFTVHSTPSGVYTTKTKTYQGRKHIVVPVVMMVEGVHNGSHGAILHTETELSKFVEAWNGRPVTVNHPEVGGRNISASDSPEVVEQFTVGTLFHTHMEDGKLKAEAWLDEEKLASISPTALAYIKQNRPLDVSVGVFSDNDNESGEWNGETYESIARNYRPDHLALLPGEQGACSWSDGCGVRINKKGGNNVEDLIQTLKNLNQQGYVVSLIDNKQGYLELLNLLRSKVDSMDNDMTVHFLTEVYEDSIVYEKRRREQGGQTTLYKQSYQLIDQNTKVEFTGDPVEVRRNVDYVTMQMRRTKPPKEININLNTKGEVIMTDEKKTPCCLAKVEQLISNKLTHFTDADKEWLLTQEESTIDKLFPIEPKLDPIQVNKEKALEVLRAELKTNDDYIGILPDNLRSRVQDGLKLQEAERSQLVKTIMDNAKKDTWTEDELKAMNTVTLKKIADSIPTTTDYSLMGGGVVTNSGGVKPMPLTGMEFKQ